MKHLTEKKKCKVLNNTAVRLLAPMLVLSILSGVLVGCSGANDSLMGLGDGYLSPNKGENAAVTVPNEKASGNAPEDELINETVNNADGETGECAADDIEAPSQVPEKFFEENGFVSVEKQPISTLSADVDTVSYSLFRYYVNQGYDLKYMSQITNRSYYLHTEEMVNYFSYDYTKPEEGELFGFNATVSPCPWNSESLLLRVGLRADDAVKSEGNNLVFLIDVSGSMDSQKKLPLIKKAFGFLVDNLTDKDRISIVTYAGNTSVVLEACPGNERARIMDAINSLKAGGGTYGEAGFRMACETAKSCYIAGGNNRIILASDGDFNIGASSVDEMSKIVSEQRDNGIYMSVLCFGDPYSLNLGIMETIANNGNGVYYYIDSESEAEKVFASELSATLYSVANDVKLQFTFGECVSEYRLLGYENRAITIEDFENDEKDAAEVGAGHSLTVLYEIKLKDTQKADEANNDWMKLAVRYKTPGAFESTLNEYVVNGDNYTETPDCDFVFAACVARVAMLVHESEYNGSDTIGAVCETLNGLTLTDFYKQEFVRLVNTLAEKK